MASSPGDEATPLTTPEEYQTELIARIRQRGLLLQKDAGTVVLQANRTELNELTLLCYRADGKTCMEYGMPMNRLPTRCVGAHCTSCFGQQTSLITKHRGKAGDGERQPGSGTWRCAAADMSEEPGSAKRCQSCVVCSFIVMNMLEGDQTYFCECLGCNALKHRTKHKKNFKILNGRPADGGDDTPPSRPAGPSQDYARALADEQKKNQLEGMKQDAGSFKSKIKQRVVCIRQMVDAGENSDNAAALKSLTSRARR